MGFRQGRTVCTLRCSAQTRTTAARYCKASACTAKPSTLSGAGFVPFRVSDSVDTCTSAQQLAWWGCASGQALLTDRGREFIPSNASTRVVTYMPPMAPSAMRPGLVKPLPQNSYAGGTSPPHIPVSEEPHEGQVSPAAYCAHRCPVEIFQGASSLCSAAVWHCETGGLTMFPCRLIKFLSDADCRPSFCA